MVIQMGERFKVEKIPFPPSRFYAFIAKHSPFTKDVYVFVAKRVSEETTKGLVLDVGTGPGYLPIAIAKLMNETEVVGIDLSVDMVRMAKANAEKAGVADRVKFEVMNARKMHYEDSHFDIVVSTGSFHHWRNKVKVLNEIYRVLKPRGKALIYELRKDAPAEDREDLKVRYGAVVGPLVYRAVAVHSATTLEEYQEVLSDPQNLFKTFEIRLPVPFAMEAVLSK